MLCPNCGKECGDSAHCPKCHATLKQNWRYVTDPDFMPNLLSQNEKPDASTIEEEIEVNDQPGDIVEIVHRHEEHKANNKRREFIAIALCTVALLFGMEQLIVQLVIPKVNYDKAIIARENGQYEDAIAAFEALGNYSDAEEQVTATKYSYANALYANGNTENAYNVFSEIAGYKDTDTILEKITIDLTYTVGNYVVFGIYPQTSSCTDETPIEWLVLDRDGNEALLISRYALDCQPYNTYEFDVTWENCTLRQWLNDGFYNGAFSGEEKNTIIQSYISADDNSYFGTDAGDDVEDNVFLLNINESQRYFSDDDDRICYPTDYAKQQGAWVDENGACRWWLRSSGGSGIHAASVHNKGFVSGRGNRTVTSMIGIRPAMWVRIFD